MFNFWINRWLRLIVWMCLIWLILGLSRVIMYLYHYQYFSQLDIAALLRIFMGGIRFDWVVVVVINIMLILIMLWPFPMQRIKRWWIYVYHLHLMILGICLLFNLIDVPYFSFTHKRSTVDIFYQIGGQTDIWKQLPAYIKDYWYLFMLFGVGMFLIYKMFRKIFDTILNESDLLWSGSKWIYYVIMCVCISAFSVISIRGGLQRIPLDMIDAGFYADPEYTALVINTPFSILKSIEQSHLSKYHFYDDKENEKLLNLYKKYDFQNMQRKNVVIIILESFSKEYTALGRRTSYTPFLDSMMKVSMVFENAWSNGTKSIEGIPAIISSMPSWMDNPYINSIYCNNTTQSLPILLKKEKYFSAFFHGGINGTMNFDVYSKQAGFDKYYGMNEYHNDKDFDGYWGIWDEEFLQFAAGEISKFKEPFFVSIFTLSSHHPFYVPKKYQYVLPSGKLPIQQSIAYTDMALKKFFETIIHTSWFKNTIFIITADHTGISADAYYSSIAGRYQIPLLIFNPSSYIGIHEKNIIQQIDILPTLLYLLEYPHPFFSFGYNYFNSSYPHFAVFYENGLYYLADDSILVFFKNFKLEKAWNYLNDTLRETQLTTNQKNVYEEYIKRLIQSYNSILIDNHIKQDNVR